MHLYLVLAKPQLKQNVGGKGVSTDQTNNDPRLPSIVGQPKLPPPIRTNIIPLLPFLNSSLKLRSRGVLYPIYPSSTMSFSFRHSAEG